MKTLKIDIPAGCKIDIENSDLENGIIAYKHDYPTEIAVYEYVNKTPALPDEWMAVEAFIRLRYLCMKWNEKDNFKVDWTDRNQKKIVLRWNHVDDEIAQTLVDVTSKPLYFKDNETAKLFASEFKDLIEKAKNLI